MSTPIWTPSTFYATGSLVQPATAQPAVPTPIPNPSFESGNVEWTLDAGLSIVNGIEHFGPGTWSLQADTGFAGERWAEMQDFIDCTTGESITARCQIQQGASSFGNTGGAVGLRFYDSLNGLIQDFRGNEVIDGSGGAWHQSSVTASAPANTAFVRIYIYMKRVNQNLPFWADAVEWNKISQAQSGLIFRAVQPTVGLSGSVEPVWPLVNGAQVVDNEVIWEATLATRVTWEAHAILVSGATEPTFPAQEGGTVGDNTIAWRAVSRRITDPNCPNSKIVVIAASKVFAADDDIVAYSATVNPLDWSTANDAGYLPTNLQQYGANPVSGIGLYRGNLVPMNTQGSQVWQIDEDPAQMALLDAFPVGTAYHTSISPAFNDLFFAASLGVRTTGIAGASTNLQSGDAGMPIDPLVQEALRDAVVEGNEVNSLYYPAAGQYWLMFSPPQVPTGPITLTGELDDGIIGNAYTDGPLVVGNGFAPFRWSATGLPTGLTINEFTGIVSGTPSAVGTFPAVITVIDRFDRTTTSPQSIDVAFSSAVVIGENSVNIEVRSGLNSTFPLQQTIVLAGVTTGTSIATSSDGLFLAITSNTTPTIAFYMRNSLGGYVLIPSAFDVYPSGVRQISMTADAMYLATVAGTLLRIYKRNTTDNTFDTIHTLTDANFGVDLKWSPDGNYLVVASVPNVVLRRTGDTFTSVSNPSATTVGRGFAWNPQSTMYAQKNNGTLQMYSVTPTLVSQLASTADVGVGRVRWTSDGLFLFVSANTASPAGIFLRRYSWNGVALTRISDPPQPTPAAAIENIDLSSDGRVLVVGPSAGTGIVTFYSVTAGVLAVIAGTTPIINGMYNRFTKSSDHWGQT